MCVQGERNPIFTINIVVGAVFSFRVSLAGRGAEVLIHHSC